MPAAWELNKSAQSGVLLAAILPPDHTLSPAKAESDRRLKLPPGSDSFKVIGMPYGPARNKAIEAFLQGPWSALVFMDSDVIPLDDSIILELRETKLDLVGGLYYQRFHPHLPAFADEGTGSQGELVRVTPDGWKPGDLVPAAFIPSGATLYSRKLCERMIREFPRPFEWGIDIAPVPSENGPTPAMSEDYTFSWRAKHHLGIQGYIHTGLACYHEIHAVVGPRWVIKGPDLNNPVAGFTGVI